ncbi:YeiH family protein [Geoglobus acetivorans]|uniref:Putative membrane protein YeiH n=1 Tax=Geoglobus acetivorans TaxID=565033 RepID=A0A0A7GFB7_GEOAI|nr:Putative membrane protein YeiH [Geoglobus acetivorans]
MGEVRNLALRIAPGLAYSGALAVMAILLAGVMNKHVAISPLILAIVIGMVFRNVTGLPERFRAGAEFSLKRILRLAIILLGLKLSISEIAHIGGRGLIVVIASVVLTLMFSIWLGRRAGVSEELAALIGTGVSICGASAVIAVGGVINARDRNIAFAIATVTLFGTVAMFTYPVMAKILGLSNLLYGVWAGASIHEVAQVVAAGYAVSDASGNVATVIKLSRVVLLAPVAMILGILFARKEAEGVSFRSVPIPYFVLGFVAMIFINSIGILPGSISKMLVRIDDILLAVAMAAMGLNTSFKDLKDVGMLPFYVGLAAWMFIAGLSYAMATLLY